MRVVALMLALMLCTLGGCSKKLNGDPPVNVPLSEVAPELRALAEKTLPQVTFESARKIKVKGEDVLEIRGKQPNGKIREVEVTLSGKVIEVE